MQIHLDEEQLLCLQVCLQNAPSPYHISKKKIVQSIVDMVGKPPKIEVERLPIPHYDLSKYNESKPKQ